MVVAATNVQEVTCTTCPVGCRISVVLDEAGQPVTISGNRCKRGIGYAASEVTNPQRVVTSTVWAVSGDGHRRLLPVRTKSAVPKKLMFQIMESISGLTVNTPVQMGQVVVSNILDTGVDIIASRSIDNDLNGKLRDAV